MRKDKAENISIVAKTILDNPLLRRDDIVEETGLGAGTVSRALKDLDENGRKDDRIIGLTDRDFELMQKIQNVKFKRLATDEIINNSDLDKWEQTANKRYSLFRGDATDEQGGLKQPTAINIISPE